MRPVEYKTPAAKYIYTMEFSDILTSSVSVLSQTVSATDSIGSTATSAVVANSWKTGTKVKAQFQGGTDGEDYLVIFKAITSSDVLEKLIMLKVRSKVS